MRFRISADRSWVVCLNYSARVPYSLLSDKVLLFHLGFQSKRFSLLPYLRLFRIFSVSENNWNHILNRTLLKNFLRKHFQTYSTFQIYKDFLKLTFHRFFFKILKGILYKKFLNIKYFVKYCYIFKMKIHFPSPQQKCMFLTSVLIIASLYF